MTLTGHRTHEILQCTTPLCSALSIIRCGFCSVNSACSHHCYTG